MNIGEVSRLSGLSPRTIRLYEASGIICRAQRGRSGYREFDGDDLRVLRFVANARALRFELKEIASLVRHWQGGPEDAGEVEAVLAGRVRKLKRQEAELRANRLRLQDIQRHSAAGPSPGCRIIALLAGDADPPLAQRSEAA